MRKTQLFLGTLLFTLTLACSGPKADKKTFTEEEIAAASAKANAYFDRSFDAALDRSPMGLSYLGIKKQYGKWDNITPEQGEKELAIAKQELQYALDSINPDALDEQTYLSYELFVSDRKHGIADYKWRNYDYPVNQMFGWHTEIPTFMINIHQVSDSSDAAAYVERLQGVNAFMDQVIQNLKLHEEAGVVPPKFVFPRVLEDSRNIIKGAPFEKGEPSTLITDFTGKVEKLDISSEAKKALLNDGTTALLNSVKPAYEKLIAFLEGQETRATADDGCWKFPDGEAYYQNRLKRITTTDLTPEEIHEIGLKEVARIQDEMRKIMAQVKFEGSLQDFFTFMRTDAQFYYPNTDEGRKAYLDSATHIINNMRERLDELFITKPKADFEVKRVEPFRENSAGRAFYQVGTPDGKRPGAFYANLANMKNMPKYDMEALAYHEGIPGHHMDRNIAQELTGIAKFRKYSGYTAYVEGWGLYSEFLPLEMGFYSDPYSNYGRLSMELFRACRLVVDAGIHYKKWTRQQGIDYYTHNTSFSERECVRMVERHIVMPGQATAYKIGIMKILELRKKAKEELGDKFDIREFHEVVLTSGAVPLNILEGLVNDWIATKKTA